MTGGGGGGIGQEVDDVTSGGAAGTRKSPSELAMEHGCMSTCVTQRHGVIIRSRSSYKEANPLSSTNSLKTRTEKNIFIYKRNLCKRTNCAEESES